MPRPPSGPRRIDSSGTYFAVKTIKGKRHYISLQTKLKSEAMRRWPEAQAALEQLSTPPKYARGQLLPITYLDPTTGASERVLEWSDNLTNSEQLTDSDDTSLITWAKAREIAEKRFLRRRGKTVSKSWAYNLTNGLKHLDVMYPLDTTPSDVRRMIDSMEEGGYKDSTIAIRASSISGVIDALIKGGYAGDAFSNPFNRVDTAAISTSHLYKATPDDYKMELDSFYFDVLRYTGARISEVMKGDYSEQGWLKVGKDIAKNRASIRDIPLPPHLIHYLREETGKDAFRTSFNKARPHDQLTPHSFRHGWKSAARLSGADEITSERLLGHAVGKMNQVYGVYPRELLRREAEKVWQVVDDWVRSE